MIIAVSPEGVSVIESLATTADTATDDILEASKKILSVIDEYNNDLGPHVDALEDAVQGIIDAVKGGTDSIKELVLVLRRLKAQYEEFIARNVTFGAGGGRSR